jgi:hypothetical protein
MSWDDADYDNHFMIEANDGSFYHFVAEDMYIAKEDFEKRFTNLKIKTIYKEVYTESEDEEAFDPDVTEYDEWQSYDPDA